MSKRNRTIDQLREILPNHSWSYHPESKGWISHLGAAVLSIDGSIFWWYINGASGEEPSLVKAAVALDKLA